ncbi:HIRAN domain-containing protein [Agromyces sp. H3Y2-19a]|uniref:HIRAN domain-containing protein n=1 Tax=Agromyces chromiiresistens TaxID=3030835 RepID=UPI0023B9D33C|nr:HIRAN domain-containing protein [Agromyces chromiiresistens]MDF0514723.1 HIRAN domain-containing protein [Agromyces chromiiresistens]
MPEGRESVYLSSNRWDELLAPSITPPNLRLVPYRGELWLSETTTGKLISVGNRHLARLGLWTFRVRGVPYRPEVAKAADLTLGTVVRLEREPDNEHDRNAIAVMSGVGKVGYVNKQMAARLAKLLDTGDRFKAIVVAGAPAGEESSRVQVIAADPALIAHLRGVRRPTNTPREVPQGRAARFFAWVIGDAKRGA